MKVKVYVEHVQGIEYEVDTEDSTVLAAYNDRFGEADEPLEPDDIMDLINEEDQERSLDLLHDIARRVGITSGEFVRATNAVEKE